jgi:hypothetical protein
VTIVEGFHQLPGPFQNLVFRELITVSDDLIQSLSLDEVHHQIDVVAFVKVIGDAGQVGMTQLCQQACFLLELLAKLCQTIAVGTGVGYHLLEEAPHVEDGIHRLIVGAHATRAQQADDPVAISDHLPWREGHLNSCDRLPDRLSIGGENRLWPRTTIARSVRRQKDERMAIVRGSPSNLRNTSIFSLCAEVKSWSMIAPAVNTPLCFDCRSGCYPGAAVRTNREHTLSSSSAWSDTSSDEVRVSAISRNHMRE